jgi:acetylornithine/N-succinyldiaminopimelate aminotransferase
MPTGELRLNAEQYLMNTYTRQPISIVRGRGSKVYDLEGREYIDFVAGIAVNLLGHGHPDLVLAVQKQVQHLIHTSNLYYTEPQVRLAQALVEHSFAQKVFFCNSGAEANEAAIKLARKYSYDKYGADRYEIVTMTNSFHGRTMATLTATGQEKVQKGFAPLMPGFSHVAFNDLSEVERAITSKTAAIMLEPIQAEGGVHVADRGYMQGLRDLCRERDVLLIFDEVQTGMGRTGHALLLRAVRYAAGHHDPGERAGRRCPDRGLFGDGSRGEGFFSRDPRLDLWRQSAGLCGRVGCIASPVGREDSGPGTAHG